MTTYWHPFSDMRTVDQTGEFKIVKGKGSWVWDDQGNKYLDAGASLWYVNVGHGRKAIGKAMAKQASQMASFTNFSDVTVPITNELAEIVAGLAPVPDSKVFFTSGGSDSVDTAMKMVRKYWQLLNKPSKHTIIVRDRGYHGMHNGGTSLAGIPDNRVGYGALDEDVVKVPWDDHEALIKVLDEVGEDKIAALYCEPIMGAGGMLIAPDMYLDTVRKACIERDILFVADEVITGFGRTGDWFASTRFDLKPDIMLTAKGLTSGYAPMGAVIAAPKVWNVFAAEGVGVWRHGYTYSGHATCAAAAIANLKIMKDEQLPKRVRNMEGMFAEAFRSLNDLPSVATVRTGIGFLAGIEMVEPGANFPMMWTLRKHGIVTRPIVGNALQVSPALTTSEGEIHEMVKRFRAALS